MDTAQLPVDLLRWSFALTPIVVLVVFLVILRWTASQAATSQGEIKLEVTCQYGR